jgi:hypothetical protein
MPHQQWKISTLPTILFYFHIFTQHDKDNPRGNRSDPLTEQQQLPGFL